MCAISARDNCCSSSADPRTRLTADCSSSRRTRQSSTKSRNPSIAGASVQVRRRRRRQKGKEKKISVEFDTCRKRATNLSLVFSASFLGGGRLGLPLLSGFGSFSYSGQISKTFFFRNGKRNLTKEKRKKEKEGGGRVRGNQNPPVHHLLDECPL